MHPLILLLHLAAAVMLLLWAVRMVRTGMERALGATLSEWLRRAEGSMIAAAGAGLALAVLFQSATAVGILSAGFVAGGSLSAGAALVAVLGADLGSALVVRFLAFDLTGLVPVLILSGAVMFLKFERRGMRQAGRIVLGIAFVLMALQMIGEATGTLRESALLPAVIRYLEGDPLTAFVVVALLTWGMHSSVAMVLVLVALTQKGVLPVQAAVPMVLGANFGAGLVALWLARAMPPPALRVLLGNLMLRGGLAVAALAVFIAVAPDLGWLGARPEVQVVHLHVMFNLGVLVVAAPLVMPVMRLCALMLPDPVLPQDAARVRRSALDRAVIDQPTLALASAKRELLTLGETVGEMLVPAIDVLADPKAARIAALKTIGQEVNALHSAIKLYVAEVNRHDLSGAETLQGIELTDFAINLERVGDIVAKTLLPLAEDKARLGVRFSDEGWSELRGMHARVRANLQLALNVLVSGDAGSAQALMREKEAMRRLERESQDQHFSRLARGNADSLATSNLHLEAVRAFKEINSLLVTVAHPILAERGLILQSRLAPATTPEEIG
ncbi:MAG: Na/Pi cotransporter family protein [Gemmobacter sp.]|jgi:phosphate:Na+ symporter